MFHKLITKYGLATHLALLASLPVVLQPFVSDRILGVTILWLSLFALLWLLVEPSILSGEHLSTARRRVRREIARSPFFWFAVAAVVFAAIRCWNDSIVLRFNPEESAWQISQPVLAFCPASVPGAAFLPLALSIGVGVLLVGVLYGLGAAARTSFGITFALVLGVGGLASSICACMGVESLLSSALTAFSVKPYLGTVHGIGCLVAVTCGVHAESRKWAAARLPFCLGVAGNVAGVIFFAPPLVSGVYLLLTAFLALFGITFVSRTSSLGGMARSAIMFLFGVALALSLLLAFAPQAVSEAKSNGFDMAQAFPEVYKQTVVVLKRIGGIVWKESPWCGAGIGAFPLQVQFLADKADWSILPPQVVTAVSGYWTVLAERGILGCMLLGGLGLILVFVWIRHLIGAIVHLRTKDDAYVFPFACPPVVWISPLVLAVVCLEAVVAPVFSEKTVLLAIVAGMTLSAASFPRKPRRESSATDQEK